MESTQKLTKELTDRLVVAVEEQDLLYVLFWLKEMKQVDRSEAIHGKHSSRGLTAISSLVQNPFTPLRKIILEVLLLSGLESKLREAVDLGMKEQNWPVLQILLDWKKGGKEEAEEAARILKYEMEEAADWIDRNTLSPPNPQSLTGYVELSVADQDSKEPQATVDDESPAQDGTVHYLDETSHSAQLSSRSNAVSDVPSIGHSSTPSEFRSQTHDISPNTPQDIELKIQASRHSPPAPSSHLSFDDSAALLFAFTPIKPQDVYNFSTGSTSVVEKSSATTIATRAEPSTRDIQVEAILNLLEPLLLGLLLALDTLAQDRPLSALPIQL
ncbi:hypothetical protein JCM3765_004934 [Sporobolomyces pararoseus]